MQNRRIAAESFETLYIEYLLTTQDCTWEERGSGIEEYADWDCLCINWFYFSSAGIHAKFSCSAMGNLHWHQYFIKRNWNLAHH
jgi:hypothetical protein